MAKKAKKGVKMGKIFFFAKKLHIEKKSLSLQRI